MGNSGNDAIAKKYGYLIDIAVGSYDVPEGL